MGLPMLGSFISALSGQLRTEDSLVRKYFRILLESKKKNLIQKRNEFPLQESTESSCPNVSNLIYLVDGVVQNIEVFLIFLCRGRCNLDFITT